MLRVSPTGTKAWYVQLDKNRKQKISDAALLSATVARYRAKDLLVRETIAAGKSTGKAGQRTLGEFLNGPYSQFKSQGSQYGKRDVLRLCTALSSLTLERMEHVGVSKLERWKLKRSRRVKPATINREISMLRTAFDQAIHWGFLADNPARVIKLRANQSPPPLRLLDEAQRVRLERVLTDRTDRFGTLVKLALNTGMRRNELFSLRWKDVYFGPFPSIIIEKPAIRHQNKERRIPLNKIAADALINWQTAQKSRNYLVFPSPSGGQLQSINHAWKRLVKEVDVRGFRFNDCRDDFAVRLVRAGVPLNQVRDLLGHSTIALTEKYAKFAPGALADAVAQLNESVTG